MKKPIALAVLVAAVVALPQAASARPYRDTATVLAVLSGIMWFEASFRATSYLV